MSNTYIADSTDDSKNDDTLIIIVNADGTLSVDPETLQKLIANQHHKTGISVVRVGGDGSNTCGDGTCADTNDAKGSGGEVNSHVNLTVEGFYPPEHSAAKAADTVPASSTVPPQSTTPTTVPSATSVLPPDNGGADVLSDPFSEMDAEEIQKLETALQSEQAKQILGENVTAMLDMLNVEDGSSSNSGSSHISHQEAVRMDHCYTNLSGPTTTTTVTTVQSVVTTAATSPSPRGRGRGKGGRGRGALTAGGPTILQMKGIPSGATLVPVVKQLVLPVSAIHPGTVTVNKLVTTTGNTVGQNIHLQRPVQRVIVQNSAVIASEPAIGGAGLLQLQQNAKVVVTKISAVPTPAVTPVTAAAPITQPSVVSAANKETTINTEFETDFLNKKVTFGRGRARARGTMRGRGGALGVSKKRTGGRGGGAHKLNAEEEERARRLEEEMAAALEAMSTSPKQEQFIAIVDNPHEEDTTDIPKKETENKVTEKKIVLLKGGKKAEDGTKKVKDKTTVSPKVVPQKLKANRKSADSVTSDVSPVSDEKVLLSPIAVTAAATTTIVQARCTTATVVSPPGPTASPSTPTAQRKNYPKRENRKPPAHLVDTLGPALFSTPDIIRRVSTDKQLPPVSPSPVTTSPTVSPQSVTSLSTTTAHQQVTTTVTSSSTTSPVNVPSQIMPVQTTTTASISLQQKPLEDELSLIEGTGESLLDSIHEQVTKQEEQLLAEALMLDDLPAVQADEISEDSMGAAVAVEVLPEPANSTSIASEDDVQHATKRQQSKAVKTMSQTSLMSYFPKASKDHPKNVEKSPLNASVRPEKEPKVVVESIAVVDSTTAVDTQSVLEISKPLERKLPPVEVPATRSASKRATQQQKAQTQEPVKEVATRKTSVSSTRERRKSSSDSKKRSMDSNDSDGQMGVSEDEDDESWNSEDDPDRLWCICKKPHNNRFMICCDTCEDWFHGKCVGITKAMGEQMEERGIEWSCPNCKKKRTAEAKEAAKKQVELKKAELKKSNSQDLIKPGPAKNEVKETRSSMHAAANPHSDDSGLSGIGTATQMQSSQSSGTGGGHCIVCKKEPVAGSIYCSDDCIKKHASESLALISKEKVSAGSALQSVIVFERKTGRLLAGPSAPIASGLTSWLLTHPTFEVMCPGVLPTAKFYTQKSASGPVSTQQKTPQTKNTAVAQKVQKQSSTPLLRQTLLVPRTTVKTTTPTIITTTAPSQVTPVQKPQVGSTSGPKLQHTTMPGSNAKPVTTQGPVIAKQELPTATTVKAIQPTKLPVQKLQVVTLQKGQQSAALPKGQQQITHLLKPQQQQQITCHEVVPEPAKINTVRTTSVSSTSSMSPPSSSSTTSVTVKKHASSTVKEASKKQKQSKLNLTAVKKPVKEENKVELKRSDSQTSTSKREEGPEPIRENVRKTLQESLMSRIKECGDIYVKEQEVKTIAQNVEEELHALFKDTGTKYKSKYRSLVFNIKDAKNLTLFRKIVDSSISPQQLVRLSAEEMASQELAQWREREARHQLEMIKKNELDLLQQAKTVVMKTHKGELVIESEDGLGTKNPDTSVTELESALNETISEPVVEPIREKEIVIKKEDKHEKEKEDKVKRKHSLRKKEDRHRDKKHSRKSRSHDKEYKKDRSRSRSKSRSRSRSRRHSDKGRDIKKDDTRTKEKKIEESDFKPKFEETESHLMSEIKEIVEEVIQEEVIQETVDIEEEDLTEEPSSTVNIKTPPYIESETENKPALWRGYLLMNDVAKFATTVQEVSGDCEELPNDLPETIDCVGRIHPDTVWEYIAKMKKSGSKQILVIRFSPENEEEKMSYLSLYSYLSSKNRMGVVGNASTMIKDFYVMPLASHNPVPQVLLPLDGPGFEDYRPHLLLGIIVRTRRKRLLTDRDLPFIPKVPKRTERSYTPPLPDEGNSTPVQSGESFTPPHNSPVSSHPRLITLKHKSSRHSTTKEPLFSPPGEDIIEDGDAPYSPADEDTPYSPGEGEDEEMPPPASPGDMEVSAELQRKMDELNRRIEEQKQQIQSIVAHSGNIAAVGIMDSQEDEAYSPSRSFTPPPATTESIPFLDNQALPDIALPSNLQEILASIKKQPEPKGLTLKLDPIVQAYSKSEEPYSPEDKPEPPVINDVDDYTSASVTPPDTISAQPTPAPVKINRDPRQRGDAKSIRTSLSQLSDEDLIRKAAEMGFMNPENPETLSNESNSKSLVDQPPPPGLEDEYHGYDAVQKPVKSAPVNSGPGPPIIPSSAPPYPPPAASYNTPPYTSYPPMYPPPNFSSQSVYQQSQHIPFTNPQPPPPPQPIYQPPPPQPPPPQSQPQPQPQPQPVPPPPKEASAPAKKEHTLMTRKLKKSNLGSSGDKPRATRKFSGQVKSYDGGKESMRKREKFLDKRERRQNWEPVEKRKDSWEYEQPPHPPPSLPSSSSTMRGVMRGRYPHQQRGFPMRRGFDHSNRGGYHRGFHRQRGHPMGPPRGGYPPKHHAGIQNEWDETIRHFEVKHRERNNKLKRRIERERRWRGGSSPPRKKRNKDSDSED